MVGLFQCDYEGLEGGGQVELGRTKNKRPKVRELAFLCRNATEELIQKDQSKAVPLARLLFSQRFLGLVIGAQQHGKISGTRDLSAEDLSKISFKDRLPRCCSRSSSLSKASSPCSPPQSHAFFLSLLSPFCSAGASASPPHPPPRHCKSYHVFLRSVMPPSFPLLMTHPS